MKPCNGSLKEEEEEGTEHNINYFNTHCYEGCVYVTNAVHE